WAMTAPSLISAPAKRRAVGSAAPRADGASSIPHLHHTRSNQPHERATGSLHRDTVLISPGRYEFRAYRQPLSATRRRGLGPRCRSARPDVNGKDRAAVPTGTEESRRSTGESPPVYGH